MKLCENTKFSFSRKCSSPADLLCAHVEQDVSGCQAKGHTIDQEGAGVRDQGDSLQSTEKKTYGSRCVTTHLPMTKLKGLLHERVCCVCVRDLGLVLAEVG